MEYGEGTMKKRKTNKKKPTIAEEKQTYCNRVRSTETIVAIDPGSGKCGLAVLSGTAEIKLLKIVKTEEFGAFIDELLVTTPLIRCFVLGGGTGHSPILDLLRSKLPADFPVHIIDEKNTSMAARKKYFVAHPPRGLLRLLPAGLRVPPRPVDDYAAVVIGEFYIKGTHDISR